MPTTSNPNYSDVFTRPNFPNGSSTAGTGGRRVTTKDPIKAEDINTLREVVEIMFHHSHTYQDSTGSC